MPSKTVSASHDPSVLLSAEAPEDTKRLWNLHGHAYSDRYLDPSLNSISALIGYAATTYQDQTAFLYPVLDKTNSAYASISWARFHEVTDAVASKYSQQLGEELAGANESGVQPTVAVLGRGTGIEFYITVVALQKLNVRTLLFNPTLSSAVIQSLLDRCNAIALIQDEELSATPLSVKRKLSMIEDPFSLSPATAISETVRFEDGRDPWNRHSVIIHTSGSTGLPKPIIHTNRSLLLFARMYRLYPTYHIQNWPLLFGLQGITSMIILPSGFPYGLPTIFPPRASPPSPEAILSFMRTVAGMGYPPDCLHTNPQLIEVICNHIIGTTKDFSPLRDLKVLQPGGAPLNEQIARKLIEEGVNVRRIYGTSELGLLMRTYPHDRSNPRIETMRLVPLPGMGAQARMELIESGLYELVVHQGFPCAAEIWGSHTGAQVQEGEVFRTNDLFAPDEDGGEGSWILKGRRDDMLILAAGGVIVEAVEVEDAVVREAEGLVRAAMLVGHGRGRTGLLVELRKGGGRDDGDHEKVWEAVEKVNRGLLWDKARVAREMVRVLRGGKTLPVGVKGHVRRKEAGETFRTEIEELYGEGTRDQETEAG